MNFYGPKTEEKCKRKVFLKLQRSYKVNCWNQLPSWETSARGTTNQKPYKSNDIRKFFLVVGGGLGFLWKYIFKILR
jgi:hypothetical protein